MLEGLVQKVQNIYWKISEPQVDPLPAADALGLDETINEQLNLLLNPQLSCSEPASEMYVSLLNTFAVELMSVACCLKGRCDNF